MVVSNGLPNGMIPTLKWMHFTVSKRTTEWNTHVVGFCDYVVSHVGGCVLSWLNFHVSVTGTYLCVRTDSNDLLRAKM